MGVEVRAIAGRGRCGITAALRQLEVTIDLEVVEEDKAEGAKGGNNTNEEKDCGERWKTTVR